MDQLGMSLENMLYVVNNATARFGPDNANSSSVYDTVLYNGVACLSVLFQVCLVCTRKFALGIHAVSIENGCPTRLWHNTIRTHGEFPFHQSHKRDRHRNAFQQRSIYTHHRRYAPHLGGISPLVLWSCCESRLRYCTLCTNLSNTNTLKGATLVLLFILWWIVRPGWHRSECSHLYEGMNSLLIALRRRIMISPERSLDSSPTTPIRHCDAPAVDNRRRQSSEARSRAQQTIRLLRFSDPYHS